MNLIDSNEIATKRLILKSFNMEEQSPLHLTLNQAIQGNHTGNIDDPIQLSP